MKPIIQKLGMVVAVLLSFLSASAYDFEADGFYFNITNQVDKTVEVTYKDYPYNSYSGIVDIPSTVNHDGVAYSVTSIGQSAFSDCYTLVSASIPNSVTYIGAFAFFGCEKLYSLTIGSGVRSINQNAFSYRDGNKARLLKIKKVFWLGNTPPFGVSEVSASVNYVSNKEFKLSEQKVYPFLSSRFEVGGVVYVPVSPSDRTCDVIDCNYAPTSTEIVIDSIVNNRGVELKVLNVNDYAFYYNDAITSLTISNNGYIGDYAFYSCDALVSVESSNNGYIGSSAFNNCDALVSVEASNNGYIGSSAFNNCDALVSVEASNNGYIGDSAFNNCDALVSVEASNNGDIGESAFNGCISLESASLNNKGFIGNNCFSCCKKLTSVNLGPGITEVGVSAFRVNSSLKEIVIPDNVTKLGGSSFSDCSSLENVSIGRSILNLPDFVFSNCSSLASIIITSTVQSISDYAFDGCINLSDVTFEAVDRDCKSFPDLEWTSTNHSDNSTSEHEFSIEAQEGDVLSFEIWSDSESDDILTAYINGTSVGYVGGSKASKLITFSVRSSDPVTIKVIYKKGSYSMGDDVAGIRNIALNDNLSLYLGSNGSSALFSDCKLDEVYIGRRLSYRTSSYGGYSPFYRNASLRAVTISDAEAQIYDNEFYGCSNLQEFSCGDGVTSIGNRAFSGCSSLKSYVSGTSVEQIGQEAFSDCTALTSFTSNAAVPPACGTQALDDINKWECSLYVPSESVDDYQAAEQWKEFFFIEALGIEDVSVDVDNAPIEIFNLSGVKVESTRDNLKSGIYIVRQGNKTEKVIVK